MGMDRASSHRTHHKYTVKRVARENSVFILQRSEKSYNTVRIGNCSAKNMVANAKSVT